MAFLNIIDRLRKHSKFVSRIIIGIAILEAILVLFIGIASNNLNTNDESINLISSIGLLILSILYLTLLFLKTDYNYHFPGDIASELKSERELFELRKEYNRLSTLDEFLIDTIKNLNGQTCAIQNSEEIHLCDVGIKDGLSSLINPIVENTNYLLNTRQVNFTISVYLDSYQSLTQQDLDSGVIILHDKLNKTDILNKSLFTDLYLQGEKLEIQSNISKSFNNFEFLFGTYSVNGSEYSIICSPIPFACDDTDKLGVLFIISKQLENIPEQLHVNLSIFCRIISNWIYRYNQCIFDRKQRSLQESSVS